MSEKTKATLLMVATVIYVLSPIDFLPDALPVIGNGDDLFAMWLGMNKLIRARLAE